MRDRVEVCRWGVVAALVAAVEIAATVVGADGSWDFRNYHLYNPFALLNKPTGVDIAPAHVQTFFAPTLDLFYYGATQMFRTAPVLNAAVAVPQAVAVGLAFVLACRLVQPRGPAEVVGLGVFTAIAATGVAGGSTIATTLSESLPSCFVLLGLLLIVGRGALPLPSLRRLFGAGLLVGVACGLKLTFTYATAALLLALLAIPRRRARDWVARPVVFGMGVAIGAVALSGYWWVHLWLHYRNPVFPMMNNVFRSPFAVIDAWTDRTFLPRSLGDALSAPWSWALRLSRATSESRLRDPRFSLALAASVLFLLGVAWRRSWREAWPSVVVTVWFFIGFWAWRAEFSIYRYLAPLELASGAVMALAAVPILRAMIPSPAQAGVQVGAPLLALAGLAVITVYPYVNRARPASVAFDVAFPALPPGSTVLLLDNEPMAYLAAFADPRIRFVGTNDFFMSLDGENPMQKQVAAAIQSSSAGLWGLEAVPEDTAFPPDRPLAHYGLTRGECQAVPTNVSVAAVRLCRLQRGAAPEPGTPPS